MLGETIENAMQPEALQLINPQMSHLTTLPQESNIDYCTELWIEIDIVVLDQSIVD